MLNAVGAKCENNFLNVEVFVVERTADRRAR